MKHLIIFILVAAFAVLVAGCGADRALADRDSIEKTVNGFFESISSDDFETLEKFFPVFHALNAAERDAYVKVFSGFSRWEVGSVAVDGYNAVATVTAFSETGAFTLQLPLTYLEKRWIVTERTSMRADIGTVPAK
ncbi:MAG: hypothetical protein JW852_01560 [Spirochaetales bacterium]|nr:hypothetical protein [Spirochaetales bacterium]